MNAGLSSLTALKAAVLPDGLRDSTEYDDAIKALGLGVAARMERHCNRKFQRIAEADDFASYEAQGGVLYVSVDRYPLESVQSIMMLPSGSSTWEDETDALSQFYAASGIVEFTGKLGTQRDKLRITFAGGWWWATAEPDDVDFDTDVLPFGATALPDDLLHAWHLQCQHEIQRSDLLRNLADKEDEEQRTIAKLDFIPVVLATLKQHLRY